MKSLFLSVVFILSLGVSFSQTITWSTDEVKPSWLVEDHATAAHDLATWLTNDNNVSPTPTAAEGKDCFRQ